MNNKLFKNNLSSSSTPIRSHLHSFLMELFFMIYFCFLLRSTYLVSIVGKFSFSLVVVYVWPASKNIILHQIIYRKKNYYERSLSCLHFARANNSHTYIIQQFSTSIKCIMCQISQLDTILSQS